MSASHTKVGAVYIGQPYCLELSSDASTTVADDSVFDLFDTDYSLEFWLSSPSNPDNKTNIISKKDTVLSDVPSDGWECILRNNGKFGFVGSESGTSDAVYTSTDVCDNSLHQVIVSHNNAETTIKFYLDGEFEISDATFTGLRTIDSDITIGGSGGESFLHQLRVYNDTLTDAEISDLYSGKKADRDACVADWRFGNGRGTDVYDQSGNGHAAILGSTDLWNSANATSDMLTIGLGFFNWSLDYSGDEHDCTEFGGDTASAPYPREFIPGLTSWTATAERYWKCPDFMYRSNNDVYVRLYWDESNDYRYEGWGTITGVSTTTPVDDLITESITIRGEADLKIESS